MNDTDKPKLQARINTGGRDGCAVCHGQPKRERGSMETYLSGTERWVCPACASLCDENLCHFAYGSGGKPEFKRRFDPIDCHSGRCPVCASEGRWLNIGCDHWIMCERHGLRWCIGSNLTDSWKRQTEEDWARNRELLARCIELKGREQWEMLRRPFVVTIHGWLGDMLNRLLAGDFRWASVGDE